MIPDHRKRFQNTIKFISELREPILCIGPDNEFDRSLCKVSNSQYIYTEGDLDQGWRAIEYRKPFKAVYCFDVIEYLMNPLDFFTIVRGYLSRDTIFYITYQYNPMTVFWSKKHFVQYPKRSFEKLIEKAGYQIVKSKRIWFENYSFKPIRPILRALTSSRYYYALKLRG